MDHSPRGLECPLMRSAAAFAFAVFTASGCLSVTPRPRSLSTHGEIVHAALSSEALGVDKDVTIWLPRRYGAGEARCAVIVLLHGVGGDETDFERMEIASRADEIDLDAIVVMPDGDDGYWVDWAGPLPWDECMTELPPWRRPEPGRPPPEELAHFCVRRQRYESYVVHDLLDWVDATYRTRPERGARGIGGMSMGGLGALSIAMRHPDVFSVAVSHSGAVSLLYAGPHPFEPGRALLLDDSTAWGLGREERVPGMPDWVRRIYGPDLEGWRAHDFARGLAPGRGPVALVRRGRRGLARVRRPGATPRGGPDGRRRPSRDRDRPRRGPRRPVLRDPPRRRARVLRGASRGGAVASGG